MGTDFTAEERHFLQLLDRNPEFREAVRRLLLSEELLNLPARFAVFVEAVSAFLAEQRRTNARSESRLESLERGQATIIGRIDGLLGDIRDAKGDRAIQATIRKGPQICRQLDLRFSRRLEQADLINLIPEAEAKRLTESELESYENADLVMEATDADGAVHMVAVEASHTADRNDAGRALRNAMYLTGFTGHPAVAVIASTENDEEAGAQVSEGTVRWHQLQQRDLHPR